LDVQQRGFKDILNFIGDASGINVSHDREVVDRPTTCS
jgi:hypothetical protein